MKFSMVKKLVLGCLLSFGLFSFAGAAEPIKIGGVLPLTDWGAAEGQHIKNGAQIAVDSVNAAGGINGTMLELIIEDGRNDPADSLNAAQKLINRDKVSAMFGCWLSSATLAIIPTVERAGIPLVVETSGADEITYPAKKHVFRTATLFSQEAKAAKKALQELGVKKVAFIAQDNDFGRGSVREFQKMMKDINMDTTDVFFVDAGSNDFYPMLTKIKNSDSDMIIATHGNAGFAKIIQQKVELGLKQSVFTTGGSSWPYTIAKLAGTPITGSYHLGFFAADYPETSPNPQEAVYYVDEWKKRKLDWNGVQEGSRGYEVIMTIVAGIKDGGGSGDPKKIRDGLEKVERMGLNGVIKFDDNHDIQPNIMVLEVADDKADYVVPKRLNDSSYVK